MTRLTGTSREGENAALGPSSEDVPRRAVQQGSRNDLLHRSVERTRDDVETHLPPSSLVFDKDGEATEEAAETGAESAVPDLRVDVGEEGERNAGTNEADTA